MIDDGKNETRALVERLYDAAKRAGVGPLREMLETAALKLDEYQAGLALATPHALTGMSLIHTRLLEQLDIEHITISDEVKS